MKLAIHLANPAPGATPLSPSQVSKDEVFRGAMQALLAIQSSGSQLTQALATPVVTAQQTEQPSSSMMPVKGASTSPADGEQPYLEGMESKIPLAGPVFLEAAKGLRLDTAKAKPQGADSSPASMAVAASSAKSQSATKRSVDQNQAPVVTVPVTAIHPSVAQAESVPAQGTIPPLSPPSSSPIPVLSSTANKTAGQGTAQPGPTAVVCPDALISIGSQRSGSSSVRGIVAAHDQQTLAGAVSLQGVKASGMSGHATLSAADATQDALADYGSTQVDSQIAMPGQSVSQGNPGGGVLHESRAAKDTSRAAKDMSRAAKDVSAIGDVAVSASTGLQGASAIESKSATKEKAGTQDVAVASVPPPTQHSTGLSSTTSEALSGSTPHGTPAEGRGSDPTGRTPSREISTVQVLQKMDMSPSADAVPLRVDARHLNVGFQSAAYGWVEVRATAGASGHVDASLHVQSSVSAETLAAHSKDIASYAREQSIQMGQVSVGVGTGGGGRQDPRSANSGATQEGAAAALRHSDAEIDEGIYGVSDTLSLISLRA